MTDISVVIGTYGDPEWLVTAQRAVKSALHQSTGNVDINLVHAETLHEARNRGAQQAKGQYLVFLDADDELDRYYLEEMEAAINWAYQPKVLVQPATLGIVDGREDPEAVVIPAKPLIDGNYMVIGTCVLREQFLDLGGFHDWPIYEDWDLWIRCALDGADIISAPQAIYRVHINPDSRNQGPRNQQVDIYNKIRNRHLHHPRARLI